MAFYNPRLCYTVFVVLAIGFLATVCSSTGHHEEKPQYDHHHHHHHDHYHRKTFWKKVNEIVEYKHGMDHFHTKPKASVNAFVRPILEMIANLLDRADTRKSTTSFVLPQDKIDALVEFLKEIETKERLENNDANNGSSTCVSDILVIFMSLLTGDSWGVPFIDAAGKPGPSITEGRLGFVGNYDQCREAKTPPDFQAGPGFSGQYCNLPLHISPDPFPAVWGLCAPSTCSSQEMTSFFKRIISILGTSSFSFGDVECLTGETSVTTATIFAIVILCLVGSLAILGTFYDLVVVQRDTIWISTLDDESNAQTGSVVPSCPPMADDDDGIESIETNPDYHEVKVAVPPTSEETTPLVPKTQAGSHGHQSVLVKILLAFSVYSNGKRILNTSTAEGSLGSIHGLRFLSISWVVLGHTFVFGGPGFASNMPEAFEVFLTRFTFDAILNALVSVDTFFTLSGLLTSYITIKELWSRGLRMNWAKFYFHRLWRLTPPYMFVLVIVLGLQQYWGEGPLWGNVQPVDKAYCERNWWTNLLYVNNLVRPDEPCFVHSWYLAVDMQFFLVSPLVLIPFYYSKRVGMAVCTCVLVLSWIVTGVLSAHHGWGVTILSATQSHWFDGYYLAPWCRVGPYVVGMVAGYVLAVKGGKPFRMRGWVVGVGWIVAVASALAVVYGINGHFGVFGENPEKSSRGLNALYNALSRSVWGACVSWVVVACAAGYGGPVNAILSWSPFIVLGRLSYMTYLIHIAIQNVFFANMGAMYFMNSSTIAILFLGLFVFSNMAAFVCVLLLESPMMGLERAFLRR